MPRSKERTAELSVDLQVQIQSRFENLMDFYVMAGLSMHRNNYYAVLRGDASLPEDVTAVELGWANVLQLDGMTAKELVLNLQRHAQHQKIEADAQFLEQLKMTVGRFMFG